MALLNAMALLFMLLAGAASAAGVAQAPGAAQQSPYAWACATAGTSAKKGCAESSCNPVQANYGGIVLVLSTGSMQRSAPGAEPLGHTPADCCNLCKTIDACNVWVFCNRKEGCGSPGSCTSYTTSLTPMSNANSLQGMLPAAGFGKYGAGCNADGTYPYGTCSLKQVSSVDNAPAWGVGPAAAEGWITGVTPKPPSSIKGCPVGLTDMTCRTCAATRNPTLCYSCMQGSVTFQAGISKCVSCANGGRC